MAKWEIKYEDYKKVLEADLRALTDVVMEGKRYDELVETYLDPENVPDDHVLDNIKEDAYTTLADGDVMGFIELNAFLGALKKINTKKKKRKRTQQ